MDHLRPLRDPFFVHGPQFWRLFRIKIGNNMGIIGNRNMIFLISNHRVLRPESRGKNYQKWTILGPLRTIFISKVLYSCVWNKIQNMIFKGLVKSNREVPRPNFFFIGPQSVHKKIPYKWNCQFPLFSTAKQQLVVYGAFAPPRVDH